MMRNRMHVECEKSHHCSVTDGVSDIHVGSPKVQGGRSLPCSVYIYSYKLSVYLICCTMVPTKRNKELVILRK